MDELTFSVLSIDGMTCNSCVGLIESVIKNSTSVKAIEISLKQRFGIVIYSTTSGISVDILVNLVNGLGFEAKLLEYEDFLSGFKDIYRKIDWIKIRVSGIDSDETKNIVNSCLRNINGVLIVHINILDCVIEIWYIGALLSVDVITEHIIKLGFEVIMDSADENTKIKDEFAEQSLTQHSKLEFIMFDENINLFLDSKECKCSDNTFPFFDFSTGLILLQTDKKSDVEVIIDNVQNVLDQLLISEIRLHVLGSFNNYIFIIYLEPYACNINNCDLKNSNDIRIDLLKRLCDGLAARNIFCARFSILPEKEEKENPLLELEFNNVEKVQQHLVECQIAISVYSMHCQSCVRKIQSHFNGLSNSEFCYLKNCTVLLQEKEVRFDKSCLIDLRPIVQPDRLLKLHFKQILHKLLDLNIFRIYQEIKSLGFKTFTNESNLVKEPGVLHKEHL